MIYKLPVATAYCVDCGSDSDLQFMLHKPPGTNYDQIFAM